MGTFWIPTVARRTEQSSPVLAEVDLTSRLRVHHNAAQTAQSGTADKDYKWYGLDLAKGKVRNSVQVRGGQDGLPAPMRHALGRGRVPQ